MNDLGSQMHDLCRRLFPICRSPTGNGVRETLGIIKEHIPELKWDLYSLVEQLKENELLVTVSKLH